MARPREFDEQAVLDAAVQCFWSRGYEANSVRDLIEKTGLTGASLYNAFGDKRAIYQRALDHYIEASVAERIRRSEAMAPGAAIENFFNDIVERSLNDADCKGCMLVNAALEMAPHDPGFREAVSITLHRIEAFFLRCILHGQADGSISAKISAEDMAKNLLGILMGIRVLARVRPERELFSGILRAGLKPIRT
jgi:TetR/AcrR family transcriptional repressor of nem operon